MIGKHFGVWHNQRRKKVGNDVFVKGGQLQTSKATAFEFFNLEGEPYIRRGHLVFRVIVESDLLPDLHRKERPARAGSFLEFEEVDGGKEVAEFCEAVVAAVEGPLV